MKMAICILAVAAISFGSVNSFAAVPAQTQQDTTKMKKKSAKKAAKKKKMMKDSSTMKKDTMKM